MNMKKIALTRTPSGYEYKMSNGDTWEISKHYTYEGKRYGWGVDVNGSPCDIVMDLDCARRWIAVEEQQLEASLEVGA
jgi:hypothetical protein